MRRAAAESIKVFPAFGCYKLHSFLRAYPKSHKPF